MLHCRQLDLQGWLRLVLVRVTVMVSLLEDWITDGVSKLLGWMDRHSG